MASFHGKWKIVFLISILSFAIADPSYYHSSIVSKEEVLYKQHIFDLFMCATLKVGPTVSIEGNISARLGSNANIVANLLGLATGDRIISPKIVLKDERFIKGSSLQVVGNIVANQGGQSDIRGGTGEFTLAQGLLTYNLTAKPKDGTYRWKLHIHVLCPMPAEPTPPPPPQTPPPTPPPPQTPPPSPPLPQTPPPPLPSPPPSLIKVGPFGGYGGVPVDVNTPPQRLKSVRITVTAVIESIEFSYVDQAGNTQSYGPWGGNTGVSVTISLGPSETMTMVSGATGTFEGSTVITIITFKTNMNTYGPIGYVYPNPAPFNLSAYDNESIVGFFGRASSFLDALGAYMLSN